VGLRALRMRDGQEVTPTAPARKTAGYLRVREAGARANPTGDLSIVMDNLSSHTGGPIWQWLAEHPRPEQAPIPTGACWPNRQEGWWRLFRRDALAGQSFIDADEIDQATCLATRQLSA